jgi:uncharacterized cupredoxin-like copper-binding protein
MRVLLAGSLSLAALVLAACGGSSGGGSAANDVNVQLGQGQEFSVVASPGNVKSGKVTFSVKNDGKVHHEMVVVPLTAGSSIQSLAKSDGEANEDGSPGEVDGVDPGQAKSVTLDLKPGTYVLLCNEPGHFAGGMATTFTVN